jgi:murein DD-endopeptidase MepM/ murein hydrolase activator NlpD
VTDQTSLPLTRRQLRELEANGRFAAPTAPAVRSAPLADAAVGRRAAGTPDLPVARAARPLLFAPAEKAVVEKPVVENASLKNVAENAFVEKGVFEKPLAVEKSLAESPAAASTFVAPVADETPAPSDVHAPEPETTEPGLLASLPLAFEASITHLPVETLAGEEPALAPPVTIEASLVDETVTSAPVSDPFADVLFAADEAPTAIAPDAIPVVAGPVNVSRKVGRSRTRRRKAAAAPTAKRDRSKVRSRGARAASTILSVSAMLFAGALLVGTSVPANAFMTFTEQSLPQTSVSARSQAAQAVEVPADAVVTPISREAFSVTSYSEVLKAKYGTRIFSFVPTTGTIRWPFQTSTTVSSGFGDRVAPCRGCSSHHNGVDFTPGMGTPIYAIADGVVKESTFGGSFGQHVYLDHVINGQPVESVYGHMIQGSSPLVTGQTVKVGDFIGLVGSTGASTGAHLHLEIRPDGVPVDPFDWLQANATN